MTSPYIFNILWVEVRLVLVNMDAPMGYLGDGGLVLKQGELILNFLGDKRFEVDNTVINQLVFPITIMDIKFGEPKIMVSF